MATPGEDKRVEAGIYRYPTAREFRAEFDQWVEASVERVDSGNTDEQLQSAETPDAGSPTIYLEQGSRVLISGRRIRHPLLPGSYRLFVTDREMDDGERPESTWGFADQAVPFLAAAVGVAPEAQLELIHQLDVSSAIARHEVGSHEAGAGAWRVVSLPFIATVELESAADKPSPRWLHAQILQEVWGTVASQDLVLSVEALGNPQSDPDASKEKPPSDPDAPKEDAEGEISSEENSGPVPTAPELWIELDSQAQKYQIEVSWRGRTENADQGRTLQIQNPVTLEVRLDQDKPEELFAGSLPVAEPGERTEGVWRLYRVPDQRSFRVDFRQQVHVTVPGVPGHDLELEVRANSGLLVDSVDRGFGRS